MTLWVKQSTAVVISFGPFVDKTDGVTLETGLVSALDHGTTGIKLSKNGGALTIRHATVTASAYDAYGMYRVTLDTTDTNTLGTLRAAFSEPATCLNVWADFMVLPANVWDSLFGADLLQVDATQILGTAIAAPATAGLLDVNVKQISTDATAADNLELAFDGTGYAGGTTKQSVNVTLIGGSTTAATNAAQGYQGLVLATAITGTLTTTSFTTDLTEATNDHYNGRTLTFTSGVLAGQMTTISDYNGTTKLVTVAAMTEAPGNGDAFFIA